jgi:hypothetical protein
MLDVPAARGMLQKGLSILENTGIVGTEVGRQITSIPQANGSSNNVGPLNLLQSPFQKLPQPLERLLKNLPIVDGLEFVKLFEFLESALKIRRLGQVLE